MALHHHVSSHNSFMYLWIVGALLVLGGLIYSYIGSHPGGIVDGEHEGDVRTTVAQFGNQLHTVSLLSPDVAEDIRSAYAPYVSEELLAAWMLEPAIAPGRTTSSPWPDHIEADTVTLNDTGAYDVMGRVMLKTSAGDAGFIPVSLTVTNISGSYLITRYEENPLAPETATTATTTLAIGETGTVLGMSLTPNTLDEDSRCPTGVMCVWEGQVRVSAMLDAAPLSLTLNQPVTLDGVTVTLTDAQPYPVEGTPTEKSAYRFTFVVEKR